MIEHAERLVIVADGSKLGEVTMATVAPADRITTLITDDAAPTQELVELEALGVEIMLVARSAPREKPVARRSREK
jgi:DeoR family transcriptional regulator, aga operon transcriptional repressor